LKGTRFRTGVKYAFRPLKGTRCRTDVKYAIGLRKAHDVDQM